jgi:hypothetical protein
MYVRLNVVAGLSLAVLLGFASLPRLAAQEKAQKAEKTDKKGAQRTNIQGTVENISKDKSTITVRISGTATRTVVYSGSTKFLYGHSNDNKPGNVSQLKEQNFISCDGTPDAKAQLVATTCVYRETK